MSDTDNQWYFDLATGVVSQGKAGNWTDRMGPYATEAEARDALALAAERTRQADEYDEAGKDDYDQA